MDEESLTISVIVPAYNAALTLPACLDALQHQTRPPDEIIVVDDGSTDETAAIARRSSAGVTVISQSNKGPAAARNQGAALAKGRLLLFTDADCAPAPDWVVCLSRPFGAPDIVGAKGAYRTHSSSLVARFVQQEYESKYTRLARLPYIDFIDTYSAAYRRDVFLENNGFDEAFRLLEDQEFSFRLARKGYHLVFAADAVVCHAHDQDVAEYVYRKFGIGYWKAFMLRGLPEKALSDSHTSPEQRLQIGLLGLTGLFALMGILWSPLWWIALLCLTLLLAMSVTLYAHIWQHDRPVVFCAPGLVLLRAAALGAGLLTGFLVKPVRSRLGTDGLSLLNRPVKRLIDIAGALIGGLMALPVIIVAAVMIKLDSPGAVFFSQIRVGENGKQFCIHKLRTMMRDAEKQQLRLAHENHVIGPAFKHRHDPRVTRIGLVLRRWSIDELPQFWNVLRGEMSLVGPRPEEPAFVAQYDAHQRLRLVVKPGMTGPAQVAGRGDLNFDERLMLELDYIAHYSLRRDLRILWKTIGAVISGKGAY